MTSTPYEKRPVSDQRPAVVGIQSCGCITFIETHHELDEHTAEVIQRLTANDGRVLLVPTLAEARAMDNFLPSECPHDPKGWPS